MSEQVYTEPDALLAFLRGVVGLPMGALTALDHVGWTTDAAKANRAREAGARVVAVASVTGETDGYEVSVRRAA